MARPFKWRRIDSPPAVPEFKPAGGGDPARGVNTLLVEEYEAIRLKDALGLEQEACVPGARYGRGRGPGHGGGRGRGRGAGRSDVSGGGQPGDGGGFCRGNCWRYAQDDEPDVLPPDPEESIKT